MRRLPHLGVAFAAMLFVLAGGAPSRSETGSADIKGEQSIFGPWRADSVTLVTAGGEKKTISKKDEQSSINVAITEKNITLWVGDQKVADISCVFDPQPTPPTIAAMFQGQDMLGIYELKGDNLKIILNNAKKGRPKDFNKDANDMELVLQRFPGEPLMMINADGTNLHPLMLMPEYTSCGSPEWSHDGKKITFDTWRSVIGEDYSNSHVFAVNADGSEPKDLGEGTLPSWSPDGKQVAYSQYGDNFGIWIINVDGSDKHLVDAQGWSPDWSPKKDELAYSLRTDDGQTLCVYDLKTKARRNLLDKKYQQINCGLSWSPDGQWICFRGDFPDGGSELAIVHAQGQSKGFKVLLPSKEISGVEEFEKYFSWTPEGKQILAPLRMKGDVNLQLYLLDVEGKQPPQKLAGQNPSCRYYGSSWSPDGKQIVLTYWPGTPVSEQAAQPYAITLAADRLTITKSSSPAAEKPAEPGIVGLWHADSVELSLEKGAKKTFAKDERQPFSVAISEKNITMRVGDKQFAEMSYVADAKQAPPTIDVKYQGQDLPGIFELKGDNLMICLNDAKQGRPKNFQGKNSEMVIALRRFHCQPLMMIDADGRNLRALITLPEYTCGSPAWSRDGSKIVCDAWRSFLGYDWGNCQLFLANADGSDPKHLGDGTLPSFSPDGKQISFSRYTQRGIWIMNADGSDKKLKLIDPEGWSADWSPKNKDELAYTLSSGNGDNIVVRNLKTNEIRYLLDKQYRQIMWGISWSLDGQWILFKGILPGGGEELAMVSPEGQTKGFKVLLPNKAITNMKSFETCFSFSPDAKQVVLSMTLEGDGNKQIYILDIDGNTLPQRLADQKPDWQNYTPCWSPDGKKIIFAYHPGKPMGKKETFKDVLKRILRMK